MHIYEFNSTKNVFNIIAFKQSSLHLQNNKRFPKKKRKNKNS